jgi:hypothetical protein
MNSSNDKDCENCKNEMEKFQNQPNKLANQSQGILHTPSCQNHYLYPTQSLKRKRKKLVLETNTELNNHSEDTM